MPEISMTVVWIVAIVALLIVEGLTSGLVTIWFAIGALAGLICQLVGAPLWLQLLWFVLVSVTSLVLTRPLAKKYVNANTTPTNADMAIGRDCVVTETIDNVRGTGAVTVGGKIWTARMAAPDGYAEKGAVLTVLRIEGVKLIVEEKTKLPQ